MLQYTFITKKNFNFSACNYYLEDGLQSVLCIGSAYQEGGLPDMEIAQISYLNFRTFSEVKLWFIMSDIQLLCK